MIELLACAAHSWALVAGVAHDPELVTKAWRIEAVETDRTCGYCGKAADYAMTEVRP